MSKFKPTPRPWSVRDGVFVQNVETTLATTYDWKWEVSIPQAKVNALLIAQSPERDTLIKKMLQAAEEYTGGLFCVFCNADGDQNDTGDWVVCHQEDCPGVKMQMLLREIEGDDA